jgi:hypothetical protein
MTSANKTNLKNSHLQIPVAVILQRRAVDHPWLNHEWRASGLILDPPSGIHGRQRAQTPEMTEYFAECDPIDLFAQDAEGYETNIESDAPSVWVISDADDEDGDNPLPLRIHLVTISAYEAQEYLDPGELQVDVLPMPEELLSLTAAFCAAQPKPEPFKKRKRDKLDAEEYRFGKEPLAVLRQRMKGAAGHDQ